MTFSSIEESAAWGAGYDAANAGVSKLVATAELLERKRIIKLLEEKDNEQYFMWLRGNEEITFENYLEFALGFRLAIALIKGENK